MNFLCMLMEECNGIQPGYWRYQWSRMQGDCQPLIRGTERWGHYLPSAFLHPPPRHSLRITKHVLPSPTSSPWSEGWSPAWDASGIRPHWMTNSCLQRWHWSGTCRRKKRARRTLMLGNWTQNESLPPPCILHRECRRTVQKMENLRGRSGRNKTITSGTGTIRQGNCPSSVTGIGKPCPTLAANEFLKAQLRVTHTHEGRWIHRN